MAFGERYGAAPFTGITEAVRATGAEAVFLCTPHPLHASAAIEAMNAGAHVLVEKPLAATLADCDLMIAAAQANGVQLGVVSQRRLYEPVQRMKLAISAGKIGKPVLGTVAMFSWRDEAYYRSDPWRGKWETEGGGVLVNQSPHHLDLLLWFMGQVTEVSGVAENLNHPYIEVEDTAAATLRFRGGGVASLVVSLSQKPGLYTKIHIHGSNGASVGAETDSGATFIAGMSGQAGPAVNDIWTVPGEEHLLAGFIAEDRARFSAEPDSAERYHAAEISNFLDALIAGTPVPVPATEGRQVVQLFDAIYRASRERRVITL
jgi:UDP-N-acetyl-2-amino-2-deoxyglucuronate dehydrogenase